MNKPYPLLALLLLLTNVMYAQERRENLQPWVDPHSRNANELILDGEYDIEELIMDIFAASCVAPFNIKFFGNTAGMGYFEAALTDLGVPAGIFIASGNIENAYGPNNSPGAGNSLGVGGHADLTTLAKQATFDAAVIEFDFISDKPELHFRYVFGSEEYPEYVCASFNDVFGFFISGPGIAGPFAHDAANVALVPMNNDLPVAINTVNPGVPGAFGNMGNCNAQGLANAQYYVDNLPGSPTFQYDGFTKPFDAKFTVIPGEVYKAVIAVADAGDAIFDSGVFISVQSLCGDSLFSPISSLQAEYIDKHNVTLHGKAKYAYDEWAYHYKNGQVTVSKDPITIHYAVPGIHEAFFTATNYCCTDTTWVTLYIDLPPYIESVDMDLPTCFNSEDGRIALEVRSSIGGLTYVWSDGSTEGPIREDLTVGIYTVTITDVEGKETVSEEYDLRVDPLEVKVQGSFVKSSGSKPVVVAVSGGHAPYTFMWSDGGSGANRHDLVTGQQYQVQVVDSRGCSEVVAFTYNGGVDHIPPDIIVVPNPAGSSLRYTIAQGEKVVEAGMLRVTNLLGQIVHEEMVRQSEIRELDVARWPEGLYLFHFENEQHRSTQKVFIRR
jgi:hypothetical protein